MLNIIPEIKFSFINPLVKEQAGAVLIREYLNFKNGIQTGDKIARLPALQSNTGLIEVPLSLHFV